MQTTLTLHSSKQLAKIAKDIMLKDSNDIKHVELRDNNQIKEEVKLQMDFTIKLMNMVMGLANEIADGVTKDLEYVLIRNKMYRYNIKHTFKLAYHAIEDNCRYARKHIYGGEEFLMEYCDVAIEDLQTDLDRLKTSIEVALREHNNEVNAQVCFAVCMLDVACMTYDMLCKSIQDIIHRNFFEVFMEYYPFGADQTMANLAELILGDRYLFGTAENLSVKTGVSIIANKLVDYDMLTEYMQVAAKNVNLNI